jgi:hypothetical protein
MTRNPHLPLTIKPVAPVPEKKISRVPQPPPEKSKISRPPAVYGNRSREETIEQYLNLKV